jgi:PAS domain S-box-containing protein
MDAWGAHREILERLVLDQSVEVWLLVEAGRGLILAARGALGAFGHTPQSVVDQDLSVFRPREASTRRVLPFGPALLGQPAQYREVRIGTNLGVDRTVTVRVQPLEGAGASRLFLVRLRDVTEQMNLEHEMCRMHKSLRDAFVELKESQDRLAEARRAASLSVFAAGLSHEINNPLAIAISCVESLQEFTRALDRGWGRPGTPPEELAEMPGVIGEARSALARIMAMILRIRELEQCVRPDRFEVVALLRRCAARGAKLELSGPEALELHTDRVALQRVLEPVLDNAALASPPGRPIRVRLDLQDGKLLLSVRDSGSGMSPEILQRACDPFFTTRPPGQGLGLGLFLASRAAASLGGSLRLKSAPGEGTEVHIEVPVVLPAREPSQPTYEDFRRGPAVPAQGCAPRGASSRGDNSVG